MFFILGAVLREAANTIVILLLSCDSANNLSWDMGNIPINSLTLVLSFSGRTVTELSQPLIQK